MEIPGILQNQIIEFLKSLPNLDDTKGRRAFIYFVGIDSQLQEQIPFDEPLSQFVPFLVSILLKYGKLKDGRNPLEAILETAKGYVGLDKKAYCEDLIQKVKFICFSGSEKLIDWDTNEQLKNIRQNIILARSSREIRKSLYEVEAFLLKSPENVDAKELKHGIISGLKRSERYEHAGIVEKNSPYVLGIDFGTTNSKIAIYKAGKSEVITFDGDKNIPSIVSMLSNGEFLVGKTARNRLIIDPENTITSIKRDIGDTTWSKEFRSLEGKKYSSVDIAAIILAELIEKVHYTEEFDLKGTLKNVVLCIPANFDDAQREAMKEAAQLAGLKVLSMIEEPVAAAYTYALEKECEQTILVYDLGGGTFDVAILKANSIKDETKYFKILSKVGVSRLGGDDFDQRLLKIVVERFQNIWGIDLLNSKTDQGINEKTLRDAQQKLKEAVTRAKHELSNVLRTRIIISHLITDERGKIYDIDMEITREQFYDTIRDLILLTTEAVHKALQQANLIAQEIDHIILTGGSTKIPLVRELLYEIFKREIYVDIDPETATVKGAAILGATLNVPEPDLEKNDIF